MSYIGVFDSGLGGLSVLKALYHQFPTERFVYLADRVNLPYGGKSQETLQRIFNNNINYFKNSKGIVVACNTMSCLIDSVEGAEVPLIGVIDSLLISVQKYYSDVTGLGVLATEYTTNSNTYANRAKMMGYKFPIFQMSAPLLVPAIEQDDLQVWEIFKTYLDKFPKEVTHLILGCTHYNLFIDYISKEYPHLTIINPYKQIIHTVESIIQKNNDSSIKPIEFLTTQYSASLQHISEKIMQQKIEWKEIEIL